MKNRNSILKSRKYLRLFLIFGVAVLPFMVVNNTSAATSLTLTSSGSQSIDVLPATGTAISSDSINVTTTCRYGYNFTVQTSVDDTTLYLDGNSDGSAYTYFSPAGGFDPLNETENEWGYFYDGNTVPTNTSIFSPVPSSLEEPAIIKAPLDSPASSDINDNFNIYYGVSVSANAEKGTYKMIPDEHDNDGTIVYTATVAEDCSRYTVQFNPTSIFEGNTLSGTGTMYDQVMYDGITESITANSFTAPSGYYFAGWNTAQDGSGVSYYDQQQVVDIPSTNNVATLYAMWTDCPPNTVCYSSNISNPNDVEGEMGDQIISSSDTSVTLYAPNFKRGSYGFAAWNTNPSGTGANYGPNQTLEFTAGAYDAGGIKLYAKWIASAGNMQNWSGCSSMNIGDVTALKDTRDNDVYAVAKLADGKCWTIENLRLDDTPELSSTNTHNPSLPLTNIDNPLTTSNHLTTASSVAYNSTTAPEGWCMTDLRWCVDQSRLRTDNTVLFTNNASLSYDASSSVYAYGNYYNWYSATAGHGTYSKTSGDMAGDICPAGWHLPTSYHSGTTKEYNALNAVINNSNTGSAASNKLRSYPNNFVYSGYVNGSSVSNRGSNGRYISSSAASQTYPSYFYITSSRVDPGASGGAVYKSIGYTIRCVAGV